jgi:hypothetical protein
VIGREGVVLYRRENAAIPVELEQLTPFHVWQEQVHALLERSRALRKRAGSLPSDGASTSGERQSDGSS